MRERYFTPYFVLLLLSIFSQIGFATTLLSKPDAADESAEFGMDLARYGTYTVIAADQHNEVLNAPVSSNPYSQIGAVYLVPDSSWEPTKKYQFLKSPSYQTSNPSYYYQSSNFGMAVDISDSWIVAVGNRFPFGTTVSSGVVLIPKVNGEFVDCPEQFLYENHQYEPNCSGFLNPIALPFTVNRKTRVAVSNNHFAVANDSEVRVWTYQFNSVTGDYGWEQTYIHHVQSGKKISEVDLTDNHLVVAAYPITPYSENDANGVPEWSDLQYDTTGYVHYAYLNNGSWTGGNITYTGWNGYAYKVALSDNRLVVASGLSEWPQTWKLLTSPSTVQKYTLPFGLLQMYTFNSNQWTLDQSVATTSRAQQLAFSSSAIAATLLEHEFKGNSGNGPNYLNSSDPNTYSPEHAAHVYLKSNGQFNLTQPNSYINKSTLLTSFPSYTYSPCSNLTPGYQQIDPIAISDYNVALGFRGMPDRLFGQSSGCIKLSGGVVTEYLWNFNYF